MHVTFRLLLLIWELGLYSAFGYKGETLPICKGDTIKVTSFIMFFKNCFDHYITYNAQKFSRTFREILNIVK